MKCTISVESITTSIIENTIDRLSANKGLFQNIEGQPNKLSFKEEDFSKVEEQVENLNELFKDDLIGINEDGTVTVFPSQELVLDYMPEFAMTQEQQGIINELKLQYGDKVVEVNADGSIQINSNEIKTTKASGNRVLPNLPQRSLEWTKGIAEQMGVSFKKLSSIVYNGKVMDAEAIALPLKGLILHTQDNAIQLTEETMHVAVELLSQKGGKIYSDLMNDIANTHLYDEVMQQYKDDSLYQNKDGYVNVTKMKKEALAKALADKVVFNKDTAMKTAEGWWGKVKKFLGGLFESTGKNVLDTYKAMETINSGALGDVRTTLLQNALYLESIGVEKANIPKIKELAQSDISMQELNIALSSFLPTIVYQRKPSEQATDSLNKIEAVKKSKGVKSADKKFVEKALRREPALKDLGQRMLNRKDSETGKEVRASLNKMIDKDGLLVEDFVPNNLFEKHLYDRLQDFGITDNVSGGKDRAIFKLDMEVTSPRTEDSTVIDLVAIRPDGRLDVFNFMGITDSITNSERRVFKKFIDEQISVLTDVSPTLQFGFARVMPVDLSKDYAIAEHLDTQISEEGFFPVTGKVETGTNKQIEGAIGHLNSLMEDLSKSESKDSKTKRQINKALAEAGRNLRYLQIKKESDPILKSVFGIVKNVDKIVQEYETKFRTASLKDFSTLDGLDSFMDASKVNLDLLDTYTGILEQLSEFYRADQNMQESSRIDSIIGLMAKKKSELEKASFDVLSKEFKDGEDISGLMEAEKTPNYFERMFRSISQQNRSAFRALYTLARDIWHATDTKTMLKVEELKDLKSKFDEHLKANNMSGRDALKLFTKQDTHELIDRYKPEFYESVELAKSTNDIGWIKRNIDTVAYAEKYKEMRDEYFLEIDATEYHTDPAQNKKIQGETKKYFESKYDLDKMTEIKNNNELMKFPKESWQTQEFINLSRPENKAIKDTYDSMIAMNRRLIDSGVLHEYQLHTFMPYVKRSKMEGIKFGSIRLLEETLGAGLVRPDDDTLGKLDSQGDLKNDIPVYFTEDFSVIDREGNRDHTIMSRDVFHLMYLMETQINRHEATVEIESRADLLERTTEEKNYLATTRFGKRKAGAEPIKSTTNVQDFQDFKSMLLYGHKYTDEAGDYKLMRYSNKWAKTINKAFGRKVITEEYDGRDFTAREIAESLKQARTITLLGLNIPVSFANITTNSFHAYVNSGEFIQQKDMMYAHKVVYGGQVFNSADKKTFAVAQWFMPRMESGDVIHKSRGLRMNKIDQYTLAELAMINHKITDYPVQMAIAIAHVKSSMIGEDGKIVNINQFVRNKPEYADRFSDKLSADERKQLQEKMQAEIDNLKETKALDKVAKEDADGYIVIDGVKRLSEDIFPFRERIQQDARNATGMGNADDVRAYQGKFWLSQLMHFKSWIPRTIDSRAGEFRHVEGTGTYEWGRWRVMADLVGNSYLNSINNAIGVLTMNDTGIGFLQEAYTRKKQEFEFENPGQEFRLDQNGFMEMYKRQIKAQLQSVVIQGAIAGIAIGLSAYAKGEDEKKKGFWRYANRMLDKSWNEVKFYYSPAQWANLSNGNLLPAIDSLKSASKIMTQIMKSGYGLAVGDAELTEKEMKKASRNFLRAIPIVRGTLPLWVSSMGETLREDLGFSFEKDVDPFGQ